MQTRRVLALGQKGAKKFPSNIRAADGIPQKESGKFTMTRRWRLLSRNGS